MAEFHALPIALRLLKNNVFETRVKPYLKPIDLYVNYDSENVITKVRNIFYFLYSLVQKYTKRIRHEQMNDLLIFPQYRRA